ncbi:MAG: PAS domain-containing protein [Acidimicrobiales bacterium]
MWVYDVETLRFLEVNDAAVADYGYSRAEFLEMTISDIRPADGAILEVEVRATAERLGRCCGPRETLARLGGGRIALLTEARDEHEILQLASAAVGALDNPVAVPGRGELKSGASVGIAIADGLVGDAVSVVRDAASAMRHAGEHGDGRFVVFNAELRESTLEAFEIEQALVGAVGPCRRCRAVGLGQSALSGSGSCSFATSRSST